MDSAVDMKKRKRLAALKAKAAAEKAEADTAEAMAPTTTAPVASSILGMGECDLGASP